jgi:hypothetical protein
LKNKGLALRRSRKPDPEKLGSGLQFRIRCAKVRLASIADRSIRRRSG